MFKIIILSQIEADRYQKYYFCPHTPLENCAVSTRQAYVNLYVSKSYVSVAVAPFIFDGVIWFPNPRCYFDLIYNPCYLFDHMFPRFY